jgi:hypothetical protein
VTGKVLRVKQGNRGVHFFDFCEDYRLCLFTVVVFPGDLKRIATSGACKAGRLKLTAR